MKRVFDIILSVAGLLMLAPLFAGLAVAIRVSSGAPVLYRSRRIGLGGRTFEMLKFRTMVVDAPDVRNADGSTFSPAVDPRVTRVGYWLRRTSLDELPQLWNVVKGDMSLVGPRPDLPDQARYYAPADYSRLDVRPGLTGLAQVNGRNAVDWAERRKLDRVYVETRSFIGDLAILVRTLPAVFLGRGVFHRTPVPVKDERDNA